MIGIDRQESVTQIQNNLRRALDGTDPNLPDANSLLQGIFAVWDSFADKAQVWPRLQFYFTQRTVCDNLLGGVWPLHDYGAGGVTDSTSQVFKNLHALRDDANGEINTLLAQARASYLPAVGLMGQGQMGTCPAQGDPLSRVSPYDVPLGWPHNIPWF